MWRAEIVPLHSSLGNKSKTPSQNKKEREREGGKRREGKKEKLEKEEQFKSWRGEGDGKSKD